MTAYIEVHLEGISPPHDTITTVKKLDIAVEGPPPVKKSVLDRIRGGIKESAPVWSPFVGGITLVGLVTGLRNKLRGKRHEAGEPTPAEPSSTDLPDAAPADRSAETTSEADNPKTPPTQPKGPATESEESTQG